VTPADLERAIVRAYEGELTATEVARELDCSREHVCRVWARIAVDRRELPPSDEGGES
jgi:DNA-directed RNA polymerase specialized sigma subunit